jgi:hypothetical protein
MFSTGVELLLSETFPSLVGALCFLVFFLLGVPRFSDPETLGREPPGAGAEESLACLSFSCFSISSHVLGT